MFVFKDLLYSNFPAKTGRLRTNNQAVIKIAQTNKGKFSNVQPGQRLFITVVIILIEPNIELSPAICKLRIDKSTAGPAEYGVSDNGG